MDKTLFFVLLILNIFVFSSLFYVESSIDDNFKIKSGDNFKIDTVIPITAVYNGSKFSNAENRTVGEKFEVDLKVFGITRKNIKEKL